MNSVTDNYNPKVSNPNMSVNIPQMRSGGFQAPFFFGGSQVPYNLGISQNMKGRGSMKGCGYKIKYIMPTQTKQTIIIPRSIPFRK
jgi:hypothetical protein